MQEHENELENLQEILEDIRDNMPTRSGLMSTASLLFGILLIIAALPVSAFAMGPGIVLAVLGLVFYLESRLN